jgi:hypothetical protein
MGSPFPDGQQPPFHRPDVSTMIMPSGAEPSAWDAMDRGRGAEDLAEADRIRRRRPRSLLLLTRLRIGMRKRPRMSRRTVRALVAEPEGASLPRDPARATHGEAVVHSVAGRRAGGVLHATYHRLSWLLRRTDRLRARKATLDARIRLIPHEHIAHPYGGHRTLEQTQADWNGLAARVNAERGQRSRKHERLRRWFCRLPRMVLGFDFLLLLYFMSGITDVNWVDPESPQLAFAFALAAMITLVSYGCFAFAGDCLRAHKDHSGRIPLGSLDWLTRVIVVACIFGVTVLGLLMFSRMWSEVILALGNTAGSTAISVSTAVTAVSVLANMMVISVHALDGSKETDYLDAFGAAVRRPLLRADRMRRRAARLEHRIAVRVRKAQRVMAGGMARAEWPPVIAEEIVGNARAVHQSSGTFHEARTPAVARGSGKHHDLSPIREAAERALRFTLMQTEAELLSGHGPTGPVSDSSPASARPSSAS